MFCVCVCAKKLTLKKAKDCSGIPNTQCSGQPAKGLLIGLNPCLSSLPWWIPHSTGLIPCLPKWMCACTHIPPLTKSVKDTPSVSRNMCAVLSCDLVGHECSAAKAHRRPRALLVLQGEQGLLARDSPQKDWCVRCGQASCWAGS